MRLGALQESFLGPLYAFIGNKTTNNLNAAEAAANGKLGFGFTLSQSATLNTVRVLIGAVAGSLGATDIECHVYDDSGGSPNASLVYKTKAITTAGWYDFTGFEQALSPYVQYYIVFKNQNATPASNYPAFYSGGHGPIMFSGIAAYGGLGAMWNRRVWNGSSWTTATNILPGIVLGFAGGLTSGCPFEDATSKDTDYVYAARELGCVIRTPAAKLAARGAIIPVVKVGTPPDLICKLYRGTTLVAKSTVIPVAATSTSVWFLYFDFADPTSGVRTTYALAPNTDYRIVLATSDGSSGDTSNYYYCMAVTWENSTTYAYLRAFGGMAYKTYLNSTWTDTANKQLPFGLVLDNDYSGIAPLGTVIT